MARWAVAALLLLFAGTGSPRAGDAQDAPKKPVGVWTRTAGEFQVKFDIKPEGMRVRLARGGELHPVQRAFHKHHALQCGFCTPGVVLTAVAVLEREPHIGEEELRRALSSSICRCTGYTPIMAAVLAAQRELAAAACAARRQPVRPRPRLAGLLGRPGCNWLGVPHERPRADARQLTVAV